MTPAPRGRRPSTPDAPRTKQVTARLSAAEREACELAARRAGLTLSEWARAALVGRAAPPVDALELPP